MHARTGMRPPLQVCEQMRMPVLLPCSLVSCTGPMSANRGRSLEPKRADPAAFQSMGILTGGRSMCTPSLTSHPNSSSSFMLRHHSLRYTLSPAEPTCADNIQRAHTETNDRKRAACAHTYTLRALAQSCRTKTEPTLDRQQSSATSLQ